MNEPTGWVSVPVVMPKKDHSQIRLNVDMRVANQAIPRRHTQHPTIDDVVNELSGSTVFSHLDMSKGYHQLELKESSRSATTFQLTLACTDIRGSIMVQGQLQRYFKRRSERN